MENHNNLLLLDSLARKFLDREEYAEFLTIMEKIRDRSIPIIESIKQSQNEIDHIRYPHDIELLLQCKVFQNNQKGERIKLSGHVEFPFLIKARIDQKAEIIIKDICDYIVGINK